MAKVYKLSDTWHAYQDGKITFYGVMQEYEKELRIGWLDTTYWQYLRDYERFILPYLDDAPLETYERDTFDEIIDELPGRMKALNLTYSIEREQHMKHIMKSVLEIAEEHDICPNVLWGTEHRIAQSSGTEEALEKEFVRLRKSLTISEERKVAEAILRDPAQSGESFGLALMFCLGLRNGEACGADFMDVRPMDCDPDQLVLIVYKTAISGGKGQKYGGKTSNVSRIIPIPAMLKDLLEQRRALLLEKLLSGELPFPMPAEKKKRGRPTADPVEAASSYVDRLPIACVKDDFTKRYDPALLTRAGSMLLRKAQVEEDMLSMIDREIRTQRRTEEGLLEKDPTAYLLRRNLGTHLYLLGLEDPEIEYIIGHEIEDPQDERSFYRNEEKLYPIAQKMARRPIVNPDAAQLRELPEVWMHSDVFTQRNICKEALSIPVPPTGIRLKLRICQRELKSRLRIRIAHTGIESIRGKAIRYENQEPFEAAMRTKEYLNAYARGQRKPGKDTEALQKQAE